MWSIHCLNYDNPVREKSMSERFQTVGITDFTMYYGVSLSDPRIDPTKSENVKRCHSCMYGHLTMIEDFLNNHSSTYGIFCEDDILLDVDFKTKITGVIEDFEKQKLDVLLLGYLVTDVIDGDAPYQRDQYKYYEYTMESVWGTQMYMLSRKQARHIIDKYMRAESPTLYEPFSADWTITKEGNRRIVYPMLAIEDGKSVYEDKGQARFHALAHSVHLNVSTYI